MSAPAKGASARQQAKANANSDQHRQKTDPNTVPVSCRELLTINSRCGGGYADLPKQSAVICRAVKPANDEDINRG